MTTAIIGGGAAGISAAIAAAERGQHVLVLERNRKPLKKLGITGNGRANLLNSGAYMYFGDEDFALKALSRVGYPELRAFFQSLGVPLREESEGRVYPAALQAAVVVDALLLRAAQLGVEWKLTCRVESVARDADGFVLHALQTEPLVETRRCTPAGCAAQALPDHPLTLRADRVIVTVGGASAPAQGTDGSAYGLLTAFGHRLTPLRPALCALLTEPRRIVGLAGQRVRSRLRLLAPGGETLRVSEGEVLFADDAVSGIAAMQLARFYVPGASVAMDLRPSAGWDSLDVRAPKTISMPGEPVASVEAGIRRLADLRRDRPLADLLTGTYAVSVARLLYREAGLGEPGRLIGTLSPAELQRLADTVACLRLPLLGTRGFDQAQVTAGGILTDDFTPDTMESKRCPGLYAAGEVLNVDGECGGFNLMFAFASGILAGRASAKG